MQLSVVDIFFAAAMAIGAVRGMLRGLSRELADLVRVLGAFLAAYFLYRPLAALLIEKSRLSDVASAIVAFLLVLLAAFLVLTLLHILLSKFMQFAFKGPLERLGGLLSGLLKGAVFASVVVLLLGFWPHPAFRKAVREDSYCGRWLTASYPGVYSRLVEHYPGIREFERNLTNSVPEIVKPDADEEAAAVGQGSAQDDNGLQE